MLDERKAAQHDMARIQGELALMDSLAAQPVALLGGKPYALGYVTKARILYFFMGSAAAMFIAADVIAQFDGDESTRTATSWVKQGIRGRYGIVPTALFILWLALHFFWNGFPL